MEANQTLLDLLVEFYGARKPELRNAGPARTAQPIESLPLDTALETASHFPFLP